MRKRGLALLPPPHFISLHTHTHTLTMWKWDGKYQQVHAYTFTHRHAVRRLSCEYLQDGRLVYIFKTRSESHAALKSPLRALETHSGGLWKTHLFQKCHQSVSLDLWPVESKKKNPSITECGLCCLLVTLPDLTSPSLKFMCSCWQSPSSQTHTANLFRVDTWSNLQFASAAVTSCFSHLTPVGISIWH